MVPLTHALNAHFPPPDSFHVHSPFARAEMLYAIDKDGIHSHPTVTLLYQRQSAWQASTLLVCTRGCNTYTSCFSGQGIWSCLSFSTFSFHRKDTRFSACALFAEGISFSKSVEMHDKVIGEFINREFFQLI